MVPLSSVQPVVLIVTLVRSCVVIDSEDVGVPPMALLRPPASTSIGARLMVTTGAVVSMTMSLAPPMLLVPVGSAPAVITLPTASLAEIAP